MISRHFINLEVKGVGVVRGHTPWHLASDLLLRPIYHVKVLIILNADNEFVGLVLDAPRNVTVRKVRLSKRHQQLKSAFVCISFKFPEEHAIVPAETDLPLSWRHDNVKDCVYLEGLRLEDLAHRIHLNDIHVAEVLSKDEELFFDTVVLVLEKLDIIDPLLQLLVVLLLESVNVKDKKVPIIAPDPSQVIVYATAEKTVTWSLLYDHSAQFLVIDVQLVALASGKDEAGVVSSARGDKRASPVNDRLTALNLGLAAQSCWQFLVRQFWNGLLLSVTRIFWMRSKDKITVTALRLRLIPHVRQLCRDSAPAPRLERCYLRAFSFLIVIVVVVIILAWTVVIIPCRTRILWIIFGGCVAHIPNMRSSTDILSGAVTSVSTYIATRGGLSYRVVLNAAHALASRGHHVSLLHHWRRRLQIILLLNAGTTCWTFAHKLLMVLILLLCIIICCDLSVIIDLLKCFNGVLQHSMHILNVLTVPWVFQS